MTSKENPLQRKYRPGETDPSLNVRNRLRLSELDKQRYDLWDLSRRAYWSLCILAHAAEERSEDDPTIYQEGWTLYCKDKTAVKSDPVVTVEVTSQGLQVVGPQLRWNFSDGNFTVIALKKVGGEQKPESVSPEQMEIVSDWLKELSSLLKKLR